MNLLAPFITKSVNPYAGTASGIFPGASAHVDTFRSELAPSPITLIQENLGTANACVTLNSDLVAKTRLRLYVKTRKGEGSSRLSRYGRTRGLSEKSIERLQKNAGSHIGDAAEVEEVTEHPVLDLLRKPNSIVNNGVGMSMFSLLEATQTYQEIVGRCYWYVERNGPGGMPSQLWILAPQFVTEWPGSGADAPIIEYYEFALGSGKANYATEDVVPFRMMDPMTGGYTGGLSPLRTCFEAHKLARITDAMVAARIRNGGKPDAIFTPELNEAIIMGKDEAARLEGLLRSRYRMAGAGSIVVADIPGKLQPISWPLNDVIDLARYQLTRAQIAEAFHVPLTKLNRDTSNRAAAQTGEFAHALDAGLPRCRRNESAMNTFLIGMYGDEAADRLFFAFDDPPGMEDPEMEQRRLELATKQGQVSGNELRSLIHLKPTPQGEVFLAPNNLAPLQDDGKPDPAYYRGANTDLASQEGDTTHGVSAPPVDVPAKPNKDGNAKLAKAMLRAIKSLAMARQASPLVIQKTDGPHRYSCVMASIPMPHRATLMDYAKMIPDSELAGDGRENDPHVTVKYGLHDNSSHAVRKLLKDERPIQLTLGKTAVFKAHKNRPESDVVVLEVDSDDLRNLNDLICENLPHANTYADYTPHLTLAYVKAGMGHKYTGRTDLSGEKVVVDRLVFSDQDNNKSEIHLTGGARQSVDAQLAKAGYTAEERKALLSNQL